jgi:hypothetical protein
MATLEYEVFAAYEIQILFIKTLQYVQKIVAFILTLLFAV